LQALGKEYLEHKKKIQVKVVNAEEVWDFDSGDYSSTKKPESKKAIDKTDKHQKAAHGSNKKNINKGDVDDIFDDLGEEEF
jgi:hypothetical protein